ncbi:Endonuclease/exonuclease/phosphatase [Lasiosphaeris hirsuta]|uniref:Endonuclease/exonuclease/phosphatase n=1 Tax=Lasiosphaeris hirsuta TaxID=260670 RepID=A0AA40E7D8_9PEZI|nr:Endonuclease/exonuclease/phosphatase [Lasiosphaeris hirsuta]
MFDTLEADIVVIQETKIQRKDLEDDMVLVPGWDVYFSLPKYKKGYSGVAIYTRSSKCCPIRAEEGITGVLTPPNSSVKFRDLPADQQIGGYPRPGQLSSIVDEATLDSEGRCVILEFTAFVLIGVYSPAMRDETRTEFRQGFMDALDIRVRNLAALGKQVILCGDLNIIRSEMDSAGLIERLRKESMSMDDFFSTPSRRLFNQLVFGGRVIGDRDDGREEPVLWDLCREFHPARAGMYTCWETKRNARPGNFGSRIDYVLCTSGIKTWFSDANIQEGLMGSDHCPVFATLTDAVARDGAETQLADMVNPEGMFRDGKRLREWSPKDLLPTSAKLIPEFDRRRNIRDMFKKATPTPKGESAAPKSANKSIPTPKNAIPSTTDTDTTRSNPTSASQLSSQASTASSTPETRSQKPSMLKRHGGLLITPRQPPKRNKATTSSENPARSGSGFAQSSLRGFLKPKTTEPSLDREMDGVSGRILSLDGSPGPSADATALSQRPSEESLPEADLEPFPESSKTGPPPDDKVFDPIASKESWSKLLGKRKVPKCEHGNDCQSLTTKKSGVNCGQFTPLPSPDSRPLCPLVQSA